MKSSAYLLFYRQPRYMGYIPLFLQENLDPPSVIFQKSQPLYKKKKIHTMNIAYDPLKQS